MTPAERRIVAHEARRGRRGAAVAGVVGAACLFSLWTSGVFDFGRYADFGVAISTIAGEAIPPDWTRWPVWLRAAGETLAMAVAGTAIGAALAFAAATAALPLTGLPRPARAAIVALFAAFRALPELVLGTVLVAAVGFGALPGVWALALHSFGMLGKFFLAILSGASPAPANALVSQGASSLQALRHAVVPQVAPALVDVALYRLEHNIRASAIIGMVGAGGLGQELVAAMRLFEYREMSALLIVTLGLVLAVEFIGDGCRRWMQG